MPKSEIINDVLRFVQFGEGNSVTCIASHQVPPEIIVMISVMMVIIFMMRLMFTTISFRIERFLVISMMILIFTIHSPTKILG